MAVFYLEPNDGNAHDPSWATTRLKEGCWVRAKSEARARDIVAGLTLQMTFKVSRKKLTRSPWLDPGLTDCRPDNPGINVPSGIIVTVSGKTIS